IPGLTVACLSGRPFAMTDGGQTRDLLYVDDLVAALLLAATRRDLSGAVLNLSGGREYVVREVAEEIARLAGTPELLRVGSALERPGELYRLLGSGKLADEALGWRPRTGLLDGLRRTVEWYREHLSLFEGARP
ncbi:MAG TPA: GDP-mannose 4,6-dehydratase, partial [Gemmatimonadales bacterium]|nr:GDP-mannose 4,6-dehydratase [Gemmatimonadales bacterium]